MRIKDKTMLIRIVLGLILIIIGVIGLVLLSRASSQSLPGETAITAINATMKNQSPNNQAEKAISGIPSRLEIPNVAIDLKVVPGYYDSRTQLWTISLNNAQFASVTEPANNKSGLTFIYGHYRRGVFLSLPQIIPGAEAKITTENGHKFLYKFRTSVVTVPADTSLFTYRGKPILVVQTCSGSFYQNRRLFVFDFSKVLS